MQLNDAVRKLLYTEQAERHVTMPRCKKGNTFPDEGWHDGDDGLVNRVLIQKRPDDLTSAHNPDVLASLRADAFGKGTDRLGDEVDARGYRSRRRLPREHIVHGICTEARAHLQTPVEGFAAEDFGIGGALEFRETVEALWSWPFRQPIEIAISSSHVAVRARRNNHVCKEALRSNAGSISGIAQPSGHHDWPVMSAIRTLARNGLRVPEADFGGVCWCEGIWDRTRYGCALYRLPNL